MEPPLLVWTYASITCDAMRADPEPQPPCCQRTTTTMSGFLRGAIPTNRAFAPVGYVGGELVHAGSFADDLRGAGLSGKVDALFQVGGPGGASRFRHCRHAIGDDLPVCRVEGHIHVARSGIGVENCLMILSRQLVGKDDVGPLEGAPEAMPAMVRAN